MRINLSPEAGVRINLSPEVWSFVAVVSLLADHPIPAMLAGAYAALGAASMLWGRG